MLRTIAIVLALTASTSAADAFRIAGSSPRPYGIFHDHRAASGVYDVERTAKAPKKLAAAVQPRQTQTLPPPMPTRSRPLPPTQYDYPYGGRLNVTTMASQEAVRERCPSTRGLPVALACSRHNVTNCWIVIADDATITAAGVNPTIVRRHEIGHCNGWPSDHAGARSIEEAERQKAQASREATP
jgi:hypothetical protein